MRNSFVQVHHKIRFGLWVASILWGDSWCNQRNSMCHFAAFSLSSLTFCCILRVEQHSTRSVFVDLVEAGIMASLIELQLAFFGLSIWSMHGHALWLFLNLLRVMRLECNLVRVCIGVLEYVICPGKHYMKTAFLFQLHCMSCWWKFGGWRAEFFSFFFCSVMPMVVEWRLHVQHAEVTWVMFSRVRASKLPRMQGTVWTVSLWSSPQETSKSRYSS